MNWEQDRCSLMSEDLSVQLLEDGEQVGLLGHYEVIASALLSLPVLGELLAWCFRGLFDGTLSPGNCSLPTSSVSKALETAALSS